MPAPSLAPASASAPVPASAPSPLLDSAPTSSSPAREDDSQSISAARNNTPATPATSNDPSSHTVKSIALNFGSSAAPPYPVVEVKSKKHSTKKAKKGKKVTAR